MRLKLRGHIRDLELFNLVIDSKLWACDLLRMRGFTQGERIARGTS